VCVGGGGHDITAVDGAKKVVHHLRSISKNKIMSYPECGEVCKDPPTDARIQCFQSKSWFQESCADYWGKGSSFVSRACNYTYIK
jgi:hypothetical protein